MPENTPLTAVEQAVTADACRAIAAVIRDTGGAEDFAAFHDISLRVAQRLAGGRHPPPAGLAAEVAAALPAAYPHRPALEAFAAQRRTPKGERR